MKRIVIVAETGSDVSPQLAAQYDIEIVPMHVTFDGEALDDGQFPVEKIREFYKSTGKLPTTSGSTPDDFNKVFDSIHERYPEAHILYLAYSAITTCSMQSGVIASEDRDYVTIIDTKQVSAGQCAVVVGVAEALQNDPDISLDELIKVAQDLIERANMCFLPDNLEFLCAGGRVSNAAYLGSRILSIHPCIEILEGKLMATVKFRGKTAKCAKKLITEFSDKYNLDRSLIWIVYTVGTTDEVKEAIEETIKECGYERVRWIEAGGVITTHGGPGAFGLAGFSKK
ncbi:MAG: DegV family EDD domain-containing protein [Lachnospiraceae bacterium]|nr:DegV family EDD domain-containing protein [Lachnospiraceae bacterium]